MKAKAKYVKVMCCPDCGFNKGVEDDNDGMPDRDDFRYMNDKVVCPCGCVFEE